MLQRFQMCYYLKNNSRKEVFGNNWTSTFLVQTQFWFSISRNQFTLIISSSQLMYTDHRKKKMFLLGLFAFLNLEKNVRKMLYLKVSTLISIYSIFFHQHFFSIFDKINQLFLTWNLDDSFITLDVSIIKCFIFYKRKKNEMFHVCWYI